MKRDILTKESQPDQKWIDHGYKIFNHFASLDQDLIYEVRCKYCGSNVFSLQKAVRDSSFINAQMSLDHPCKNGPKLKGFIIVHLGEVNFIDY